MKNIVFFCGLLLLLSSCKKENESSLPPTPTVDSSSIFPYYVISDKENEFFIKGTYNGKKICLSPSQPLDTFYNAYFFNPSIKLDQLNLIRSNAERSAEMQIYIGTSSMLTRAIPYYLPHPNLVQCEFTQFQFYDSRHRHGTENDALDDYTYQGSTNTGMKLIVTNFKDGIISGTFEGKLKTNTGKIMKVQEGSFNIKIHIILSGNGVSIKSPFSRLITDI